MSSFKYLNNGWGIQPLGSSPLGGDFHETWRVTESGELVGGHTTIRLPGNKGMHLPWD